MRKSILMFYSFFTGLVRDYTSYPPPHSFSYKIPNTNKREIYLKKFNKIYPVLTNKKGIIVDLQFNKFYPYNGNLVRFSEYSKTNLIYNKE